MRLGVFGGSFNPVHYGHLLLAETCREQCSLDQVWFVPAAIPPHKRNVELADDRQRVEMLELAVGGHQPFIVSTLELERGGVSYTVDTLQSLAEQHSECDLYFLMGADSLAEFGTWREPRTICELATPIVVCRSGSPQPRIEHFQPFATPDKMESIAAHQVEMPVIDLSSTRIRMAVADGKSIRFQTPRAVERYIQTHQLYIEKRNA